MFSRQKRPEVVISDPKIYKRVQSIPTDQLIMWFDNCIDGIGELVDSVIRHGAPEAEVTVSLETLLVMWREIQARGIA